MFSQASQGMMKKAPTRLYSYLRLILISSVVVSVMQSFASFTKAQRLVSGSQNLDGSSSWVNSDPGAYSTRAHNFEPTQSASLVLISTTGSSISSTARYPQRPNTTPTNYQILTQPKSLKFTLTAGKYWKFNIKTNSLQTNHVEKELRLHKNVSAGNYIIDDDGWFQYNHQQQQLFAWPSLSIKPATYYFVLLPSGLDYEADGENVINIGDVVANIVVELVRPYVAGGGASTRLDLDQLIDYKLSLDFLHRHSSYPLLLTQIVSIFDLLSKATANNTSTVTSDQNSSLPPQSTQPTTSRALVTTSSSLSTNPIVVALQQNKQARLAGKFTEFLLIDFSATQDGEFFSITWTTQPTLVNNTIVPINQCRLSTINDTIFRLSSRSILYPVVDDKFVISYALEGPLVNSQAIIPTERGNYALKLSLLNACKNKDFLDELGVTSARGFPIEIDDRDNNIPSGNASLRSLLIEAPEIVPIEHVEKQEFDQDREHVIQSIQITNPVNVTGDRQLSTPIIAVNSETASPSRKPLVDSQTTVQSVQTTTDALEPIAASRSIIEITTGWSTLPPESQPTPDPLSQLQTSIRRALGTSALPPTTSESQQQQQLKLPKLQPQAKSFENFLDSSLYIKMNSTILLNSTTTEVSTPPPSLGDEQLSSTKASVINASSSNSVSAINKSSQESSLNDDLIGILNEITDLMVSIAVPLAIVLGIVLISSILIAICNLCIKKRKSKQFEVSDRFKFRYGSERKGFLKKSSKPVILEADQKSLSMGGTPRHQPLVKGDVKGKNELDKKRKGSNSKPTTNTSSGSDFFAMSLLSSGANCDGGGGAYSGDCSGA